MKEDLMMKYYYCCVKMHGNNQNKIMFVDHILST